MLIAPWWHGSLTNLAEIKGLQIIGFGRDGKQTSPALVEGYKLIKSLQGAFGRNYKIHNNMCMFWPREFVCRMKLGMLTGSGLPRVFKGKARELI